MILAMGPKWFLVQNIIGPMKFWVLKVQTNSELKNLLGPTKFSVTKHLRSKKLLVPTKFRSIKILSLKNFESTKNFWAPKHFGSGKKLG